MEKVTTAYGDEPEPEEQDKWWVPEEDRKDVDEGPGSDALDDETDDDMAGWVPTV